MLTRPHPPHPPLYLRFLKVLGGQNDLRSIRRSEPDVLDQTNEILELKSQNDLILRMLGAMHEQITAMSLKHSRGTLSDPASPSGERTAAELKKQAELEQERAMFASELRVRPKSFRARKKSGWAAALRGGL